MAAAQSDEGKEAEDVGWSEHLSSLAAALTSLPAQGGTHNGRFFVPPLRVMTARAVGPLYAQAAVEGQEGMLESLTALAACLEVGGVVDLLQFLAKRGLVNPRVMGALLRPDVTLLSLHDGEDCQGSGVVGLGVASKAAPGISHIDLDGCRFLGEEELHEGLSMLTSLVHVSLQYCSELSNDTLQALLDHNHGHLEYLDIAWCENITDAGLAGIDLCPALRHVCLAGTAITGNTLRSVLTCPSLSYLSVRSCSGLEHLRAPFPPPGTLKGLSLSGLHFPPPRVLVEKVGPLMPTLESLALDETRMDLPSLLALAMAGAGEEGPLPLTRLSLSWCEALEEGGPGPFLARCPALRHLSLRTLALGDEGLAIVGETCPRLTTLNLARCSDITNAGVEHLVNGCPLLEDVDLSWSMGVTDAGLRELLHGLPRLQVLTLEGVKRLTPTGVVGHLTSSPYRHQLRHLDLSWVDCAGEDMVAAVTRAAPYLTVTGYYTNTHGPLRPLDELLVSTLPLPPSHPA